MPLRQLKHQRVASAVASVVLALALVGCGSSHGSTSTGTHKTTSPKAAVTADWQKFFSPKTPVNKRVALLQDGSQFAQVIHSQAHSPMASAASAKITKVDVVSNKKADVTYSIMVGGKAALKGQHGTAVKQGGTWKVGVGSFCKLLALEHGGSSSSLPAACRAAG